MGVLVLPERTPVTGVEFGQTTTSAETARILGFTATLEQLAGVRPQAIEFDFTETAPVKSAADRFLIYDREAAPVLYLHPDMAVAADHTPTFTPRIARSGKRSGHGVFFGDLDFGDNSVAVAVKPHTADADQSCLKDYLSNCAVNEAGVFSLSPVGFILDAGRQAAYSLTVLEESLTTLDSLDWSRFYPEVVNHPGMQEDWLRAARLTAFLHANGSMNHGDLAPRNIAKTSDGQMFFIDWELAHVNLTAPRDAEVRYGLSLQDLSSLLDSFCRSTTDKDKPGIGIFYGKQGDWWEAFSNIFYDEYETFRREIGTAGSHHALRQREVESELVELRNSLQRLAASLKTVDSLHYL